MPQEIALDVPGQRGGRLRLWLFESARPASERALIVFFHGNAENRTTHYQTLMFLLEQGYDFAILDYRGYADSVFADPGGSKITPETTVQDGVSFLRWAEERAKAKKMRWGIFAQSLGGAIAQRAVQEARDQIHPQILILDSTFLSYRDVGQDVLSRFWVTWPLQRLSHLVLSDRWSPVSQRESLSSLPIVVMHGSRDPMIDEERGREIFHFARSPKEFWRVEGGRHTEALWGYEGQFRRKLLNRLDEAFFPGVRQPRAIQPWAKGSPVIPDWTQTYRLPYRVSEAYPVLQTFEGGFTHQGVHRFAIDFSMPPGTWVCAMRAGRVIAIRSDSHEGGTDEKNLKLSNYVVVEHADGTQAEYYHLQPDQVFVKVGGWVERGGALGKSGQTGWVTEPHLHAMVYVVDASGKKQSIPIAFDTREGAAMRLEAGESYHHPL